MIILHSEPGRGVFKSLHVGLEGCKTHLAIPMIDRPEGRPVGNNKISAREHRTG